jgi:hypothetical protein
VAARKQGPTTSEQTGVQVHAPLVQVQSVAMHVGQFSMGQSMRQPCGAGSEQPGAAHTLAQQALSPGAHPSAHTWPR